jgi:AcrR family transcriptional regulator
MMKQARKTKREKRLEEIVEVATEMIVADGIAGFGVNKLAAELGLTPGALYRYFDSRDDILVAVEIGVLEYFGEFFERVDQRLANESALMRVVGLVWAYAALERFRPERFKLLSRFVSSPDPIVRDESAAQVIPPTLALLSRFGLAMQQAMDSGDLDNERAIQRAALTWSCVQGVLDRRKLGRFSEGLFDPEPLLHELLETLLVGWGASRAAVNKALANTPDWEQWKQLMEEVDAS